MPTVALIRAGFKKKYKINDFVFVMYFQKNLF